MTFKQTDTHGRGVSNNSKPVKEAAAAPAGEREDENSSLKLETALSGSF